MSADDFASSVQGQRLRITPLESDGTVTPSGHVLTTSGFISLTFTPEYEDGDEIAEKAADGSVCISWKADDSFKRVTVGLSLCSPDPEATAMLTGGDLLWNGTAIDGYASPAVGALDQPAVALEVWSIANVGGKPATGLPYFRWLFPYVKVRFDGDREFGNGALANEFTGQGLGNDGLVIADWTWGAEDRPFSYVRVASLPTVGWTGTAPTP